MEEARKNRHRRKRCGHCNEVLSYSAYLSHKALFYNEVTGKWTTEAGTVVCSGSSEDSIEEIACDYDMDTTDMDLESNMLISSQGNPTSQFKQPGS